MDYTALLDVENAREEYAPDEAEAPRKSARPPLPRKRRDRKRKNRKPTKPVGNMGQRSNNRWNNV